MTPCHTHYLSAGVPGSGVTNEGVTPSRAPANRRNVLQIPTRLQACLRAPNRPHFVRQLVTRSRTELHRTVITV